MPNYDINYEDERFKQVENQKQEQLNNINNTYNNMVNQSDSYFQNLVDATNKYTESQQKNQQANTDFAIEQINQQKEQAKKDYTKEQAGAYIDWQKQTKSHQQQMSNSGLQNTGYSATLERDYYTTYQNRIISAKESYDKAVQNYDNSITQAILANNSALAEIAYNGLKTQLELSLQGFQYKNDLLLRQISDTRDIDNTYYNRWRDVLSQFNTENALKEDVRQYNENMAENKRQYDEKMAEERRQYDETMAENRRQYEEQMAYQKERDKVSDDQWQKQYNLSLASTYSKSSGSSSGSSSSKSGSSNEITTAYYSGKLPSATSNAISSYGTFSNGYQPKGIIGYGTVEQATDKNGNKLTTKVTSTTLQGTKTVTTQKVWQTTDGTKWIWNGMSMKYEKYE